MSAYHLLVNFLKMILRCRLRWKKLRKFVFIGFILFIFSNICIGIFKIIINSFQFHKYVHQQSIDVVYTWVNGSDPLFIQNLNQYRKGKTGNYDSSKQRFDDKFELKFSLRSLEKYAPWVNHVYIVTNGQIPYWLNLDYEKVTIVTHEEIFRVTNNLPTFSSPAIESNIYRISGLSKKFIYFNDDIFLGAPTFLEDFYSPNKGYLIYLAWPVPNCAPNCPWLYVSDGQCDRDCYRPECQMDGDDCINYNEKDHFIHTTTKDSTSNFYKSFLNKLTPALQINNSRAHLLSQEFVIVNKVNAGYFTNLTNLVSKHNQKILIKDKIRRKRKRKTYFNKYPMHFDGYSASLQHTNRLFNKKFGFKTRKVPSHVPILIDKDIMEDLYFTFFKEFQETETHKVRSGADVQFSFSYYYYVMSKTEKKTIEDIFDFFDTDGSSTWSDRELRTLLSQLYSLPLSYGMVDHFEAILLNCSEREHVIPISTPPYERYIDSKLPTISKNLVINCPFLSNMLIERFGTVPKYTFEIISNSEEKYVSFKMLNTNISDVVNNLDDVRSNRKKFICLNDNLDESKENENDLVRAILYDFYLSLFPLPSKYELPEDYRNRFLYVKDLEKWKSYQIKLKLCLYCVVFLLLYLTVCSFCKKNCCQIFNKLFC